LRASISRAKVSANGVSSGEKHTMPEIGDEALKYLIARAGLSPTQEQLAGLKAAYPHVAAMAANVRKPRSRMAEPVLTCGFVEEDLA
jgi:hypothetical protein